MNEQLNRMEDTLNQILELLTKPKREQKLRTFDYDTNFNDIWEKYPKRLGNNPKNLAYRAYNARRAEGIKWEDLMVGVKRYKAFCDATHKTGTEFVMQASTFFGPRYEFEEEWTLPTPETVQPRTNDQWFKLGEIKGVKARPGEDADTYIHRLKGELRA